MSKQDIMLSADCLIIDTALLAAAEYLMCHRGGRQYGSYCPTTPQNEGHRVEHSTTKKSTGTSLFLLHVLGKSRS